MKRSVSRCAGFVLVAALGGCGLLPAKYVEWNCEPACITEHEVRLLTNDVLVAAPGIWKFFDEVGEQLPRPLACSADGGTRENGLTPLWRRTIVPIFPDYSAERSSRSLRGRSALAVHPNAGLAVSIGRTLWMGDAESGVPTHIMHGSDLRRMIDPNTGRTLSFDMPVVAFTPDGKHLWTSANGPMLLNLEEFDRHYGFRADYSWYVEHQTTFLETWYTPSQSVGRDGTLYWTSTYGKTRALEPSGRIRWERTGLAGFVSLDGNETGWWSNPAVAVGANDGSVSWQPDLIAPWQRSFLPNVEGEVPGMLIPVLHEPASIGSNELALHRLDGTVAGIIPVPDPDATTVKGETLFVAKFNELSAWSVTSLQQKWLTPLEGDISVGPILSPTTDNVWVVTSDCRVSEVDSLGNVRRWHQMDGEPTDQISRLSNGILYVLSMTKNPIAPDRELRPGDILRSDGGMTDATDYECYLDNRYYCGQTVRPGTVFYLYAYRVE